jgi:uncharacterized protein YndB with AHSA1/START domain
MTPNPDPAAKYEMTTTRLLDAPIKLVFDAWVDPGHVSAWWGPEGFTTTVKTWKARAGAPILIDMNAPDGTVYPMGGRFVEVTPPGKIVFTASALDHDGAPIFENLNTILLTEEDGKTRLALHVQVTSMRPDAEQYLVGMKVGWGQSLDRLENFVAEGSG